MKLKRQNGNKSASITLPKSILDELGWECGDEIEFKKGKNAVTIVNTTKKQVIKQDTSSQFNATELWCNITNALIRKYKELSDTDSIVAIGELRMLEKTLLNMGFLTEAELEAVQ